MRPSFDSRHIRHSAAAACVRRSRPPAVAHADQTAQETIDQLQSEGYTVNVDRVGSGPHRRLRRHQRPQPADPDPQTSATTTARGTRTAIASTAIVEVVVSRSISVSLDCT